MKELEKNNLLSDRQAIESVQHKHKEIELAFIENLKPLKGHTLYEINNSTLEIVEAQYHKEERITWHEALKAFNNPQISVVKDVIIKPYHSYISALNPKSALKRHQMNKGSASLPEGEEIRIF
jgi:hypothetical protein